MVNFRRGIQAGPVLKQERLLFLLLLLSFLLLVQSSSKQLPGMRCRLAVPEQEPHPKADLSLFAEGQTQAHRAPWALHAQSKEERAQLLE